MLKLLLLLQLLILVLGDEKSIVRALSLRNVGQVRALLLLLVLLLALDSFHDD